MNDRRIRVLVVTPSLSEGGAERFSSTLLARLDRRRFEPQACLMRSEVSYPLPSDVQVHLVDKRKPWHLPRSVPRLRAVLRDAEPAIVVSTMLYPGYLVGAALAGLTGRPRWVARFGNDPRLEYGAWAAPIHPGFRLLLSRADRYVANSHGLTRIVERYLRLDAGSVSTLSTPVDFDEISSQAGPQRRLLPDRETPTLVWVGRLSRQKRPDLLLEAFDRLRVRRPVRLLICGEGPMRGLLEQEIVRRGLSGAVDLLGFEANPHRRMREADVYVLTSDYEGLPNALIEAQSLGLPAVSTRCPSGPDEIIQDGTTGLLAPVGDAVAISELLDRLLSRPEATRAMGQAAAARMVDHFDCRAAVHAWESFLEETVASA